MVLYLICNFVENQKKYVQFSVIIKIKISNILRLKQMTLFVIDDAYFKNNFSIKIYIKTKQKLKKKIN